MANSAREEILARVRRALEKQGEDRGGTTGVADLPAPPIDHGGGTHDPDALGRLFVEETARAGGSARILGSRAQVEEFLAAIVRENNVRSCVIADSPLVGERLGIGNALRSMGVAVLPFNAPRDELSQAEMGVTEAVYAIAESGTLVSVTSPSEPRSLSLLPPVHLAVVTGDRVLTDLNGVIDRLYNDYFKNSYDTYLINNFMFITGPSRTADIELNLTLGVHGPKSLYAGVIINQE